MCGSRGHNRALNATAAHDSIYRRVTAFGSDPFSHRSRRGTAYGLLAQRLAQGTHNPWVLGSNPGGPTMKPKVRPRAWPFWFTCGIQLRIYWCRSASGYGWGLQRDSLRAFQITSCTKARIHASILLAEKHGRLAQG